MILNLARVLLRPVPKNVDEARARELLAQARILERIRGHKKLAQSLRDEADLLLRRSIMGGSNAA